MIMLKHGYVTMGILNKDVVCAQIRQIYNIVIKKYKKDTTLSHDILKYLKQYIHNIARGFGLSYDDALGGAYNEEKARKFVERAKGGSKIPIGYYINNEPNQEEIGRASCRERV